MYNLRSFGKQTGCRTLENEVIGHEISEGIKAISDAQISCYSLLLKIVIYMESKFVSRANFGGAPLLLAGTS